MADGLGNGIGPLVEEVADAGVAADEDELLEGLALPAGLQQPEQPLHRDVHDVLRRLLARREMQHMGDAGDRALGHRALGDRAADDLDALARRQPAVVAERADAVIGMSGIAEQPAHEGLAHLAGGAGDEDEAG